MNNVQELLYLEEIAALEKRLEIATNLLPDHEYTIYVNKSGIDE